MSLDCPFERCTKVDTLSSFVFLIYTIKENIYCDQCIISY